MFHLQLELGLVSVSCSSQNLLQLNMCGVLVSVLWSVDSGRVDYWTVVVVGLWPVVCFAIGLLWPVADWLWHVGAHVLCFCLFPVG
jgi:hypothetical protein